MHTHSQQYAKSQDCHGIKQSTEIRLPILRKSCKENKHFKNIGSKNFPPFFPILFVTLWLTNSSRSVTNAYPVDGDSTEIFWLNGHGIKAGNGLNGISSRTNRFLPSMNNGYYEVNGKHKGK